MLFPDGTPPDEKAFVVAIGQASGHLDRCEVAPDGRFRVALVEPSRSGTLELEARYVFLDEPAPWKAKSADPVTLVPRLGGRIEGRLVAPAGTNAADGGTLALRGFRTGGIDFARTPVTRDVRADLAFAFDALDPRKSYTVEYGGPSSRSSSRAATPSRAACCGPTARPPTPGSTSSTSSGPTIRRATTGPRPTGASA